MNDLDVVKKYILQNGHVGLRRTYNHLKKDLGLNVTQKKIQDIKNEIKNSFENLSFNSLNKKVVFPYLGGWFFDIIDNRGKVGHEHEAGYTKGWAVFLHGNSGYVVAFPLNNKSGANLTKVYNEFKTYCKKLPVVVYKNGKGRAQNTPVVEYVEYPINNIVSDKEKGWGKNFDTNILKMNAGENHRFLSKINAFAGHLRKRYFGQGNTGNKQRYITKDEFDDFVTEWNLSYLNFNGCTRGQMLVDPNLELAYIASALYYNEGKMEKRVNALDDEDLVMIQEPDQKYNAPKKQNQLLPQKYKVVETNGNTLKVVNINDEKDVRDVHFNDIKGRFKGMKTYMETEKEKLKDVEIPRISQKVGSNVVEFEEVKPIKKDLKKLEFDKKNKDKIAKKLYVEEQRNWEKYGFPSDWRPKTMYEAINKLREKLDQDTFNYVVGSDVNKKTFSKKVESNILRRLANVENLSLLKQDVPKTNAEEQFDKLLKTNGNVWNQLRR